MSRKLIDRDALIASIPKTNVDIFENCRNCSTLCDWQVRELIEQAELVDAVEVVHCRDCKWWDVDSDCIFCEYGRVPKDDWFCADGERRDPCSSQDS